MNLVEFAEKVSPIPLTEWQKQLLSTYERAKKENKLLICMPARVCGRRMLVDIIREHERENRSMLLPQKQECTQSKRCALTIDGEIFSAIVEEHQTVEYGFDENNKRIKFERIHRKYHLDKPFWCLKIGAFEVMQDGTQRCKCYMSDDRMRLIEC